MYRPCVLPSGSVNGRLFLLANSPNSPYTYSMRIKGFPALLFLICAVNVFGQRLEIIVEDNGNGLTITRSKGSAKVLEIPDSIGDKKITVISNGAFIGRGITEVTIPEGVTSIGDGAFAYNSLETVVIGDNVTSIGMGAFTANRLTRVSLGSSVTNIGKGAFSSNRIESVNIPDGVTVIDDYAFFSNKIKEVEIPGSVTMIGEGAFSGNRLTGIEVGGGVTRIGDGAFYNNKITTVTVPTSLETLGKRAFDSRSADGRIRDNVNYIDGNGNVLFTAANNFNTFYDSNGKKPGRYTLSGGNWSLE